jgi:glycosyltransferase involved in cell wall biosynthesis
MGGVRRHNAELLPRAARLLAERGGSLSLLEGTHPCAFDVPAAIERISSEIPPRPVLKRALVEGHALRRVLNERAANDRAFHLVHTAHQPVPRGFETPLTVMIHDLRMLRKSHSPFSRRLIAKEILGRSANRARCLMTVSASMADEIAATLAVDRELIQVVANGGDHFLALARDCQERAPMLCVGHLEPRKNQALLLRTLALDPNLPDVEFVGGNKGDCQDVLQALAQELGVSERVRFLGSVDDEQLGQLFSRTSCVVLPSQLEGFGIVALEALRARAPLAISCIPAHMEVAPNGVPHFEDDGQDCLRAIRQALQLESSAIEAFAHEVERYTWDAAAEQLVNAWCAAARKGSSQR